MKMRAKIIHRTCILLATTVTLSALAQPMPAPTTGELVLFDRQFDFKNIATQDATISETKTAFGRALHVETGLRQQWPGITLPARVGHWDLSAYNQVSVTLRNTGTNDLR